MSITGGAVLLVIIWFLTLFIVLQVTLRSQEEEGEVVPGTHKGAPADFRLGRTLLLTSAFALPLWAAAVGLVLSGWISIEDLDWMGALGERVPN